VIKSAGLVSNTAIWDSLSNREITVVKGKGRELCQIGFVDKRERKALIIQ
jgi:hypothetical protein